MPLEDVFRFACLDVGEPRSDEVFARKVERILHHIQRRSLELRFERSRDVGEDDVPEQQCKDGGQDARL